MMKALLRDRFLLLLLALALGLKLFSLNEQGVEKGYASGFYPVVSNFFRRLFGWIPFSVGDALYILAFAWLVYKTWRLVRRLRQRRTQDSLSWVLFRKYLKLVLLIYLFFSLGWGLNYDRQGIAQQLNLKVEAYSPAELLSVTILLQQRLQYMAKMVDSVQRLRYNDNDFLFARGVAAYNAAAHPFPFLRYGPPSLKPSLFTPVGHLLGFTGYYNPFTAEAQLKTSIPVFLKPFVLSHEIAHQLGYAKEDEASFVAYLTCKASGDATFLYSAYFELYRDAVFECFVNAATRDSVMAWQRGLPPRVKWDRRDLGLYLERNKNFVEPFMSEAYDRYLRLNNQPKGKATYNEVISYLIAYLKKYGAAAI